MISTTQSLASRKASQAHQPDDDRKQRFELGEDERDSGTGKLHQLVADKPVVICLEEIEDFRGALDFATELAGGTNRVQVVHVLPEPELREFKHLAAANDYLRQEDTAKQRIGEIVKDTDFVDTQIIVKTGHAVTTIKQVCDDVGCRLIVIPSRKRRGVKSILKSMLSRSLAARVIGRVPIHVLVYRESVQD